MVLATPKLQSPIITWEKLPDDFILPDDPVENIQQPPLAAALTDALIAANLVQSNILIASNFGIVANINQKTIVKAPDWLYVPSVSPAAGVIRRSYTPNIEGSPVAVVMEFLSDTDCGEYSIRPTPPYGKLYFYEQVLQVPTYAIFDPYTVTLEVRRLENGRYILQETSSGRFWIPELELFLGIWQGTRPGFDITNWLRWWNEAGNLLLWSSEQAELERQRAEAERQRAEAESQRAELLAAKLRELGIDPEAL
jgi:Uma2 family endonuclease